MFQWHTQARLRRRTHLLKFVACEIDNDGGENQRGPTLLELILQMQPVFESEGVNTSNRSKHLAKVDHQCLTALVQLVHPRLFQVCHVMLAARGLSNR